MSNPRFPPGWDEKRVQALVDHYENQPEDEAVAEDEAGFEGEAATVMKVPAELVPKVRQLIAEFETVKVR